LQAGFADADRDRRIINRIVSVIVLILSFVWFGSVIAGKPQFPRYIAIDAHEVVFAWIDPEFDPQ
jgi:hypothetical protein